MPKWTLTVDIDASPDAVWAVIGDPVGVPKWFPKYVSATVDGDTRTLVNDQGGELVERLLTRDDARRHYSYSVIAGAPVASHEASFEVVAEGTGSRVIWTTDTEAKDPAMDMQARLTPAQTDGLQTLKAVVEG
jgi:carbon monoxide dehydrogenase subunit G